MVQQVNTIEGQQQPMAMQEGDQKLIEFEQALMALAVVPTIANPCMKRTIMVGPKKFVGKKLNSRVHQHTNKKLLVADFDTLSLVQSATTGTTHKGGRVGSGHISTTSGGFRRSQRDTEMDPEVKQRTTGAVALSDLLDTNSCNSAGLMSQGLTNHAKDS